MEYRRMRLSGRRRDETHPRLHRRNGRAERFHPGTERQYLPAPPDDRHRSRPADRRTKQRHRRRGHGAGPHGEPDAVHPRAVGRREGSLPILHDLAGEPLLHHARPTSTATWPNGTDPLVMRDDTAAALTHAEQLRSAHEFPTLAGSATLPFITDYYQIGDRVKIIQGRNANMQINVGVDQGETPSYPWVTAFAWDFSGDKQQTVIQFSDRRAEPHDV